MNNQFDELTESLAHSVTRRGSLQRVLLSFMMSSNRQPRVSRMIWRSLARI